MEEGIKGGWTEGRKRKEGRKRGDRLWSSKSDVCRRQILTSKVNPRTVRVKIFITAVETQHRYSTEAETASYDIYDDSKLKKKLWPSSLCKIISAL